MRKVPQVVLACSLFATASSCEFVRNQKQNVPVSVSLDELQIHPNDWLVQENAIGKLRSTTRSLKPEKLETIRRNFRSPRFSPLTVPEANGFEIFEVQGYSELESAAYIQPKLFVNTGTSQGSILGYRIKKESSNEDQIEISIPVALVNGLVPAIPLVGGAPSGSSSVVRLPEKYQVPHLQALEDKVGKKIQTLPVCPKLFRLTFEDQEYWAKNPFEGQSHCPLNQFFRIKFTAPMQDMQRMLETAAVRDESVTLITHLSTSMGLPKQIVEVQADANSFRDELVQELKELPHSRVLTGVAPAYTVPEIEEATLSAFSHLARDLSLSFRVGSGVIAPMHPTIARFFGEPFQCQTGGVCRSLKQEPSQHEPISFSWEDSELLFSPLEVQTVTALNSVANSSLFEARPSQKQLSLMRRPQYFKGRAFESIVSDCHQFQVDGFTFNPETLEPQKAYFVEYCKAIVENTQFGEDQSRETDGYYPLGANTTVYPGAWLRIDIDEISELTTARTKALPNGRIIIEPKVIDLLSIDGAAPLTSCSEGSQSACIKYKTERKNFRDSLGSLTSGPCQKGTPDCVCTRKSDAEGETCTRNWYEALSYECDPSELRTYCPYWKSQEEIIDYEIDYECQNKTVEEGGFFWKRTTTQPECHEKQRKPVKVTRQRLNCLEDDSHGIAPREQFCTHPKYRCEEWSENCTRYQVNEAFQVMYEDISAHWRPFAIESGEYPKRFEEEIFLKFVSPNKRDVHCRLDRFPREFHGNSIFIKIPSEDNDSQPCDMPLWEKGVNTDPSYYPKVFIQNKISYAEERLCGKTEYSFLTKGVKRTGGSDLIPGSFTREPEIKIGPVEGSCLADNKFRCGNDYWFTEYPPIRFSGRVSVLGRILQSIVTEAKL